MSLIDAITDLKSEIVARGYVAGMVEEIARDYEVNPILLARKFTENTGRAPADYSITKIEIDYAARFEAMRDRMARDGWNLHGRMKWSDLTPDEQARCASLIEQQLTKSRPTIAWIR